MPLPAHSRNRIGRHTGWLQNGNRTTIPTITHRVAAAQLGRSLRGAVVGPERVVHLLSPAAKQRVIHHDGDRSVGRQQSLHDQPRDREPEPIGVPPVLGEEPARAVKRHQRSHPGAGEHAHHGAPRGARDQTGGQQHEQPERGRPREHRPQWLQQFQPRGG